MDKIFTVDWKDMWLPTDSIIEIIIRGTIMYLGLFIMLRVVLKRQSGAVSISDLLVLVLIADAAQNGMANEYKSITEGLLLVLTIIFWSYALDWLGYHFPVIQRFIRPPALPLIENGKLNRRNMRQELITHEELLSFLRSQGVDNISQVKTAFMESDGSISVISKETKQSSKEKATERVV